MSNAPGVPEDSAPRVWHYVAPDLVSNPARSSGSASHPRPPHLWHPSDAGNELARLHAERLDLNLQRFARAIEAGTTIAFLGSGWSTELGYPSWGALMKPLEKTVGVPNTRAAWAAALLRTRHHGADSPSLLEVIQSSLEEIPSRGVSGTRPPMTPGREWILSVVQEAFNECRPRPSADDNPYCTLLKTLPSIRRFVTTNFDNAIEMALKENRTGWRDRDSFSQTQPDRIALLSIAGASQNRDHVFHCHGRLGEREDDLILTESDYKRWYLGDDERHRAFRDALRVLLQSNALFVGGYSLSDADLVRTFRQLSVMKREPQTIFVLLDVRDYIDHANRLLPAESNLTAEQIVLLRLMAEQEKFGACIFPFDRNAPHAIVKALTYLAAECEERLRRWHRQPCGRALTPHAAYQMAPTLEQEKDWVLQKIDDRLEAFSVVTLCGSAASAKYLKACQYAHDTTRPYESMVFSTHGNEDVYFYLRRIVDTVLDHIAADGNDGDWKALEDELRPKRLVDRLRHLLELRRPGRKPLLLIISGFEQFFDTPAHDAEPFAPRHSVAQQMLELVKSWNAGDTGIDPVAAAGAGVMEIGAIDGLPFATHRTRLKPPPDRSRLLLTTRSVRAPLHPDAAIYLAQGDALQQPIFTRRQLRLDDRADVFGQLSFLLMEQPAAISLAAAFVSPKGTPATSEAVSARLDRLVRSVRAVPVDRGTRVVKFIVDELDEQFGREFGLAAVRETGRALLQRLSCFNRPFREEIMMACLEQFLVEKEDVARDRVLERRVVVKDRLLALRLVEQVTGSTGKEPSYVVHPLVKRYFRVVVAKGQLVSGRAFGLHSALSRGPFEDPGQQSRLVIDLFNHFEAAARRIIVQKMFPVADLDPDDPNVVRARRLTRAAFEVLRSNLSYNTVARWGGNFRDYMTLCARCYDLVKNYGIAMNDTWCAPDDQTRDPLRSARKPPLTAEEILWLLNEMGLAYYSMGALRDSLRVWTVAFEWQRVIAKRDPEQGVMYAASLYCNLGTMTLIMGRLGEASYYFHQAREYAVASVNPDLTARMDGFLARIANLRGDLSVARKKYDDVIGELGRLRNIRAQSYFMRYRGLLRARLGEPEAATDVYTSMTVAASEDHPDVVADAKYFVGRVYLAQNKPSQALPEFRAALKAAKAHSMGLLETNALVGIASAELALGDAHAALDSAFTALRLANECLWGLRQVEALTVIGEAYVKLGEIDLGRKYLEHARRLARDHQFHLHDEDIGKALATYPLPDASSAGGTNPSATGGGRMPGIA